MKQLFQRCCFVCAPSHDGTYRCARGCCGINPMEAAMGFGRGALLWLLGVPLPIILLLALFMHH
ncbi:MAG TPA: hypothetical protein VGM57_08485 [Pseudolabrys sp.]|jgi:hypothetical protein